MKISAHCKQEGDTVEWYQPFGERYDVVFMSKVFSFTPDYDLCINANTVVRGGTGYCVRLENGREVFDKAESIVLPNEIEHIYPDYSLYNITDTAYGFLTRGCPRGCEFCIVGKKEGKCSRKVADLTEFWRGQKNIVLCDPNILACPDWKDLLTQLADSKAWVDFNQGLDIRLMTPEKIELLNKIKMKEVHFAWDRYEDKDLVLAKLKEYATLGRMRVVQHRIVYTIVNFNTTFEQDIERIYTLRNLGYWAYVMIYDKEHCDKRYKQLQRWVNNRIIFSKCEKFEDYDNGEV
ncbi:MAG: hypothetical protein J6R57_02930 [Bacteroidales bacterium]|nr:hypothetical protein [Bacteroidales bacterium]